MTKEGERTDVAIQERLGCLSRISLDEASVRIRQIQTQEVYLLTPASNHRHGLAEIRLGMTRRMRQGTNVSRERTRACRT